MDYNKAIIVGRLTQDPEEKSLPSGQTVVNFSMATNRVYNDKDGNKQEDTEYHNIVFFGKTAEIASQYLSKGKTCLVEGRLQTRSWEDEETGKKQYRTEIVGRNLQLGPRPQDQMDMGGGDSKNQTQSQPKQKQNSQQKKKAPQPDEEEEEVDVEDIPF